MSGAQDFWRQFAQPDALHFSLLHQLLLSSPHTQSTALPDGLEHVSRKWNICTKLEVCQASTPTLTCSSFMGHNCSGGAWCPVFLQYKVRPISISSRSRCEHSCRLRKDPAMNAKPTLSNASQVPAFRIFRSYAIPREPPASSAARTTNTC